MTAVMTTASMAEGPMDASTIIENINATVSARYTLAAAPGVHSPLSNICQACQAIFDADNLENGPVTTFTDVRRSGEIYHQSLENVSAAALRGCHLCTIVYMNLDPAALKGFKRFLEVTCGRSSPDSSGAQMSWGFGSIYPIARDQARLSFRFIPNPEVANADAKGKSPLNDRATFMPYNNHNESRLTMASDTNSAHGPIEQELTVELILMNPAYAVEPGVRTVSSQSVSTSSDDCFEVAKQWIDDCSFNHMKCSANEGAGVIQKPTYLLDVTLKDSKGFPGVKLVDGEFLDPFTEYVTLSHCWGISQDVQAKRIRLHKKTLAPLRQGVASKSLPKTFAEAAAATLKLGYRYLWIDALCIMHDSEKAVLDEVAAMHRIYSEATVNLCATSSRDDNSGLFHSRNPKSLQPALVSVSDGFGIAPESYKILRCTTWDDLVDSSPVARRAWILQERALAKRTLHFTRNELLWECQQMCCSEVFPKGLPVTMKTMAERERRNNQIRNTGGISPSTELSNPFNSSQALKMPSFQKRDHHNRTGNWHALVEMYSALRQTYTSDKLLGISALARQYLSRNRLRPADYVAGLWKPNLPHSLLWRVAEQGVSKRPSKWRAPSWTWASLDGRVTMAVPSAASKQTCLEVIDLELTHKYDDPLGLCESGRIKVRGFMGKGSLRRTQDYWGHSAFTLLSSNRRIGAVNFENAWFDERLHKLSDENSGIMVETLEVYLLPVIDVMDRVEGLILSGTMKKGEFRRLGVFEIGNGGGTGAQPMGAMNVMGGGVNGKTAMKTPVQENWDRFKSVMKGDPEMGNYEERMDHENAYWFASDYTYTINIV